jgi:hypothetical protein
MIGLLKPILMLLLAILVWSLLGGIAEAAGEQEIGMMCVAAGELTGIGANCVSATSAPASQAEDSGSSAQVALPMAIFCGMLLSSLSIAIGIGYKRRFDAVAASSGSDDESAEPEVLQ